VSTPFRITQRSLTTNTLAGLQGNLARMQRLQEQLSSGKAVNRPSDSPSGAVNALRFRADIRRNEQMSRNASDGLAWLGQADTALSDGLTLTRRVRDLVLQGVNAATDQAGRNAIAAEIEGIRDGMLGLANTTYLGRPVFAGNAGTTSAYDASGAYLGDNGTVVRAVSPGVEVQVNVTGPDAFSFAAVTPGGPTDIFATLTQIADDFRTGTPTSINAVSNDGLAALDAGTQKMQQALATVGARYHQVETMRDRNEAEAINLTSALGEVESIDLPKTIMDLQMQEVAYQAALSATGRVIQPSLVDFLR
jgi:flagellar hook-associated protein 3 FlgL